MDLSSYQTAQSLGEPSEVPGLSVILHGSLLMPKIAALYFRKLDETKLPHVFTRYRTI